MAHEIIDPNSLITFGNKHLGKTYQHVRDIDKQYCTWILSLTQIKLKSMNEFRQYLLDTEFLKEIAEAKNK